MIAILMRVLTGIERFQSHLHSTILRYGAEMRRGRRGSRCVMLFVCA